MTDLLVDDGFIGDELAGGFVCDDCGKPLKTRAALLSHQKTHDPVFARDQREKAPRVPRAGSANLENRFKATLGTVGLGIQFFCPVCAAGWVTDIPELARSANAVAAENKTVKQIMEYMSGGGAWGYFLVVWLGSFGRMAAHHNVIPSRAATVLEHAQHMTAPDGTAPPASPGVDMAAMMEHMTVGDDGTVTIGPEFLQGFGFAPGVTDQGEAGNAAA